MLRDGPISETSLPMTSPQAAEQLTLFAVASLAKTSAPQAKAQALTAKGQACGGTCIDSSKKSDQLGSLLRMSMLSEIEALTGLSGHWSPTTSKSGVSEWQLKTSAPLIKESGCSSWPTIHGFGNQDHRGKIGGGCELSVAVTSWPTPITGDSKEVPYQKKGENIFLNLTGAVQQWPTIRASDSEHGGPNQRDSKGHLALPAAVHQWPTPTASMEQPGPWRPGKPWWLQARSARNLEAIATWPTPSAVEAKRGSYPTEAKRRSLSLRSIIEKYPTPTATPYGSNKGGQSKDGHIRPSLSLLIQDKGSIRGRSRARLNPRWVLQLMGFPSDWLSMPAAMVLYPPSRSYLAELYRDWKGISSKPKKTTKERKGKTNE